MGKNQDFKGMTSAGWAVVWDFLRRQLNRLAEIARAIGRWLVKHFRCAALVFTALMLAVSGYIALSLVNIEAARLRVKDDKVQVDYNWARAARQQAEYDAAAAIIPEIEERLAAPEPQVQTAMDDDAAMREARNEASEGFRNIRQAGEAALAEAREAEAELTQTRETYNTLLAQLGLIGEEAAR